MICHPSTSVYRVLIPSTTQAGPVVSSETIKMRDLRVGAEFIFHAMHIDIQPSFKVVARSENADTGEVTLTVLTSSLREGFSSNVITLAGKVRKPRLRIVENVTE